MSNIDHTLDMAANIKKTEDDADAFPYCHGPSVIPEADIYWGFCPESLTLLCGSGGIGRRASLRS